MHVVLWGINYHPEPTGIGPYTTELARHLAGCGHRVDVVSTFSYYPAWKKAPEDAGRAFRTDTDGAVRVHRCWHYVPAQVTAAKRILHEMSFAMTSTWRALRLRRADVYVIVSPPLILGVCAWFVTRLKGRRFVFHVQDLQPDAAVGLGMVKGGALIRVLYALERFAYKRAAVVSGISPGMIRAYERKGVPAERRVLLPNWLRVGGSSALPKRAAARAAFLERWLIDEHALVAVYSGNIGRKQRIEILVEAAEMLARAGAGAAAQRVVIVIAGAGAGRPGLEALLAEKALPNMRLLPLLDDADYARMLVAADIGLVTQAAGTGQFFFPSKLLSLLQAGLPVAAVADADSELAEAVVAGDFGGFVAPDDVAGLARLLERAAQDGFWLRQCAANTSWVRQFEPETLLPKWEKLLQALATGTPVPASSAAADSDAPGTAEQAGTGPRGER